MCIQEQIIPDLTIRLGKPFIIMIIIMDVLS